MTKDATNEYKLLNGLKQKIDTMASCSCLLSLNVMTLSIAIDTCRLAKHFDNLLKQWQECLPLGDAHDVNFQSWVTEIEGMIDHVKEAFFTYRIYISTIDDEPECFVKFRELQSNLPEDDGRLETLMGIATQDYAVVLVYALRELSGVITDIIEYLNSPTEELITRSYDQWEAGYRRQYKKSFDKDYDNWRLQFSPRTRKKHILTRRNEEVEKFKTIFNGDEEFELVYDTERMVIDLDGLTRFLFTHASRFGVSHLGKRPTYSKELQAVFNFIELSRLMDADLQPQKKTQEKTQEKGQEKITTVQENSIESKVSQLIAKVQHLVANEWEDKIAALWKKIYKEFKIEIENAGSREKFKEFSKKTLYCILGHLKAKGVYHGVNNKEFTKLLEGSDTSLRKYINNGLAELDHSLRKRIESILEPELKPKAA